ncbi:MULTISPECIES: pilin major subunit VirB2 [Rhizobium]|uniref:pilin major subunit VirB2 n=1 Tax=Rhizobium TaxID=379 RepID=UPI001C829DB6|nr:MULTISPECIES: pilin major subunit VirB2 [Rhizobium]MBX4899649.1 pilin major subunit VirB2 [Rhizobium bangladeshense]MBX5297567.1 pilin major subunit VirB2 [Rhizobium sp. NLR15a]MBY3617827.1 pilin major subunit VirB2 [Rhizobium bangladeshense]
MIRRTGIAPGNFRFSDFLTTSTLSAILSMCFTESAFAQAAGASPAAMVQNICNFILGGFGQSLAILGIIAIGVSWMFGRASLALVAGVVGGIVIMFGAAFLGGMITGGGG